MPPPRLLWDRQAGTGSLVVAESDAGRQGTRMFTQRSRDTSSGRDREKRESAGSPGTEVKGGGWGGSQAAGKHPGVSEREHPPGPGPREAAGCPGDRARRSLSHLAGRKGLELILLCPTAGTTPAGVKGKGAAGAVHRGSLQPRRPEKGRRPGASPRGGLGPPAAGKPQLLLRVLRPSLTRRCQ